MRCVQASCELQLSHRRLQWGHVRAGRMLFVEAQASLALPPSRNISMRLQQDFAPASMRMTLGTGACACDCSRLLV